MAGRPLITLDDLEDRCKGWQNKIIELMTEGGSQVEVKAMLDIGDSTYVRLLKDEPEFSLTIKKGIRLSHAWWIEQGRINLQNKDYSYTGWYMNMKNRFGWRDKVDMDVSGEIKHEHTIPERDIDREFETFLTGYTQGKEEAISSAEANTRSKK